MKREKEIKTLTITHRNGETDTVENGSLALSSFEAKKNMNVSESKVVTFHAVDHIEVTKRMEADIIADGTCEKDCNSMGDPSITGLNQLNVIANEEFDPLDGVTGYDDNGETISVTVEEE